MRSFYISLSALLVSVFALASPCMAQSTQSGLDTPLGVLTMPFAIQGAQIMSLSNVSSNPGLAITGFLTTSGNLTAGAATVTTALVVGSITSQTGTISVGNGVTIGTSAVSLTSAGNITASNSLTVGASAISLSSAGTITATNSVSALAFFQTSDARLKTNIRPSKGLEVIDALHGVTFDWKSGQGRGAGVLAQDVEKVLPSAVRTEADGHKTVEYSQLMGPIIESIKELQAENVKLEAENAELRHAINP